MSDEIIPTPPSDGTEQTWEVRFNAAERRYQRMKGLVSATLERMKSVQMENDSLKLATNAPADATEIKTPPPQDIQAKYADAMAKLKVYQSSVTAMELLYAKDKSLKDNLFDYEEHLRESNEVISALCRIIKSPIPPNFNQEDGGCGCPGCQEIIKNLEQMAKSSCMHQVLAADRRAFVFGFYAHKVEPYERKLCEMEAQLSEARMTILKYEQETNTPSLQVVQHDLNANRAKFADQEKELKTNSDRIAKLAIDIKQKENELGMAISKMNQYEQRCTTAETRLAIARKAKEELLSKKTIETTETAFHRVEELKNKAQYAEEQRPILEYRIRTAKSAAEANTKTLASMTDDMMASLSI